MESSAFLLEVYYWCVGGAVGCRVTSMFEVFSDEDLKVLLKKKSFNQDSNLFLKKKKKEKKKKTRALAFCLKRQSGKGERGI